MFDYASPVDHLIHRLKFRGALACGRLLGTLLATGLADRVRDDLPQCIVPVPLHRSRLAVRGYNQAMELARPVARRLGVPLDPYCCTRRRATMEQSALDAADRAANLRGAFVVSRCPGDDIAIIDDVMTTGHTVAALALALRQAGVGRIRVWVCARAA